MSSRLLERIPSAPKIDPPVADLLDLPLLGSIDLEAFPDDLWVLEDKERGYHGMVFSAKHQEHGVACFPTKNAAIKFTDWVQTVGVNLKPLAVKFDDARDIVKEKPDHVRCLFLYKDGNINVHPKIHYVK